MNDPQLSENGFGQVSKPERLPPFGVLDLLILVTCLCFVFAVQEKLANFGWFYPAENQLFQFFSRLVFAVQSGIPLAAAYWLIKQKRITGRFFWQPGHYMLLAFSVFTILMMTAMLISQNHERHLIGESNSVFLFFAFCNFVMAIIFLGATFFVQRRWSGVFLAYSAAVTVMVVRLLVFSSAVSNNMNSNLISWLTPIQWIGVVTQFVSFLCLLTALIMDLVQRTRRDWLHWAGMVVFVNAAVVNPVLTYVYVRYFLSP